MYLTLSALIIMPEGTVLKLLYSLIIIIKVSPLNFNVVLVFLYYCKTLSLDHLTWHDGFGRAKGDKRQQLALWLNNNHFFISPDPPHVLHTHTPQSRSLTHIKVVTFRSWRLNSSDTGSPGRQHHIQDQ